MKKLVLVFQVVLMSVLLSLASACSEKKALDGGQPVDGGSSDANE